MELEPQGEFPGYVLKAYTEEAHARAFLEAGTFRIGALKAYKTIEDSKRQDTTEGEAHVRFADIVTRIHIFPNSDKTSTSECRYKRGDCQGISQSCFRKFYAEQQ